MSQLLRKYTSSHEWICMAADGTATVGISTHAAEALGELVYVELPQLGQVVQLGQEVCVVESVKAASDVYAPLAGEVVAINLALKEQPELVNRSPETDGWLYRLKLSASGFSSNPALLEPEAYLALLH